MAIGSSQWMYSSGDYEIEQGLRFDDGSTSYLKRTPTAASNRRTWTFSAWVKRGSLPSNVQTIFMASNPSSAGAMLRFNSDKLVLLGYNGGVSYTLATNRLFRDPSAWYHVIIAVDTTQGTAANRLKMYVNGVQETAFSTATYPSQNLETYVNSTNPHYIGVTDESSLQLYFDGYMGEVNFIDGQALTPSSFGETGKYGEWKPLEYKGTYGTNGFYLPFEQDYTVEGFSTVVYEGTRQNQYIGGAGFKPDLVFLKTRSATSNSVLIDSVRGGDKALQTSTTSSENQYGTSDDKITAFNNDGFTLGVDASGYGLNNDGVDTVAWNWDMGGTTASNTNGSITSSVRANTAYGQSIVTYTGSGSDATVGTGLTQTPDLVITKRRTSATEWWIVYHSSVCTGDDNWLALNTTGALRSGGEGMYDVSGFTSTTFGVIGGASGVNVSGATQVSYCFHDVTGYSKFGSYSGNNSTSNVITTGFTPAFVMIKNTESAYRWYMLDNTRDPNNPAYHRLFANNNDSESSNSNILEFTSTGFKIITTDAEVNQSGKTMIYAAFADTREYAYWLDQSGNNNDWTSEGGLTESDVMVDSPTNNFATLNPLYWNPIRSNVGNYSEGNLRVADVADVMCEGTIGVSSGKWYYEVIQSGDNMYGVGVPTKWGGNNPGGNAYGIAIHANGAWTGEAAGGATTAASYANGVLVGIAFDVDAQKIWMSHNGTWSGANPATGNNAALMNAAMSGSELVVAIRGCNASGQYSVMNFGQDSSFAGARTPQGYQDSNDIGDFYYAPPTGFLSLCTKNLPSVDVIPSEHFKPVIYAGNGGTQSISVGFPTDFTWLKNRGYVHNHFVLDTVRGAPLRLVPNATIAESNGGTGSITSFTSDGFVLGNGGGVNSSSYNYVAWNWKAGGTAVSNTNGTITSSVSANVDAGFSIVTYSGASNATSDSSNNGGAYWTIGHGLAQAPEVVMVKKRDGGTDNNSGWYMGHQGLSATPWASGSHVVLNTTAANANESNILWGNRAPTSTTFSAGAWNVINHTISGTPFNYLAYCFHSVDGYSKVGSYTGNGSADGTFVYTGFRPAYVMYKRTNSTGNWGILDNTRDTTNPQDLWMAANLTNTESSETSRMADFLSNGFKFRGNAGDSNASGGTYIYIAFAESPFKHSNAR